MKSFDLNKLVRSNVKTVKPYSSARDDFKDFEQEMIFLDANENPFSNGMNRYPDPQQKELKYILADRNNVSKDNILIGNGSDEVLDLLFRAFCEPNRDNIITLPPTYGMYSVLAGINAIENREVLLTNDFQPNVDSIIQAIDENTKIIFLCSPNNPTGNSFSDEAILKIMNNFNGLVVIDEAYIDFSKDESWLSVLADCPNLVITQTLSKAYAMAGLRIGILYASTDIISIINKIKPPYNINILSQESALKKLEQSTMPFQVKKLISERKKLKKELEKTSFVEKVFPSDANFILIKVDDANYRYQQFIDNGIVVRNRTNQPLCENCLRISIGLKEENEKLIQVIKKIDYAKENIVY
ncbi:histidinol-phosphate transaminase [Flavobacterium okayamense]|uniref:Histidinol-phosphate aminotransferase n=1 Tax=Flavobacterium okayamense TaxID=2830782 RepID=A0ABM7S800_9FLAO|nr:histidinol-phosphate transaminase [Flavobacterium okayamense]BCY28768.1 histidinol-phosphate aminotransferase [Flavobacterium okayamense]